MASSMPFWLLGFWKPKGMRPERFVPLALRHHASAGTLVYESSLCLAEGPQEEPAKPAITPRKFNKLMRKVGENYEPTFRQEEAQSSR